MSEYVRGVHAITGKEVYGERAGTSTDERYVFIKDRNNVVHPCPPETVREDPTHSQARQDIIEEMFGPFRKPW